MNIFTDSQFEKFMDSINPPLSEEDYKIQISSFNKLKKQKYLFSWNKIPKNPNGKLIVFLRQKFGIDWVMSAKIEKIGNGMTIRVSNEINYF